MIHSRIGLATALLLLCSTSAYALDCNNAITTVDMNECTSLAQKQVEVKLNATYQTTLKFLDAQKAVGAKKKLVKAQRAWVQFRENDCAAVYALHATGTIRTLMWIGCMQSRAEQRIAELEAFTQGSGG